jgi:hypothetical protein
MDGYTRDGKTSTAAEREARKAFRETEAKAALSEYERAQKALHANRERLRAERLAREASSDRKAGGIHPAGRDRT